jgi:putative two-component system response regulator
LRKPGKLTPEEFEIIKTHTTIGAALLEGSDVCLLQLASSIAKAHHEKWDGSGYPEGLRGEDIPEAAMIVAVADVYDALASDRTYRKKMADNQILDIIRNGRGAQFDPAIVDVFIQVFNTGQLREAISPQNCEGCSNNPSAISNPV